MEEGNKRKKTEDENNREEEEDEGPNDNDAHRNAFLQHLLNAMVMNRTNRSTGNNNDELVQNLLDNGVFSNPRVAEALRAIPRGLFVPKDLRDEAYVDAPIRIASMGFNISAPHMYAVCLENLDIQNGMTFLDVGSGCGHFTALGGYLVGKKGKSLGLDLRPDIIKFAQENIRNFAENSPIDMSNVEFLVRNAFLPIPGYASFDRIHVGACCPEAQTQSLFTLLAPNGILVTPLGDKLVKVTKDANNNIKIEKLLAVAYSDLIVPSEAEIKAAKIELERERAQTVIVPPSTFYNDWRKLLNQQELSDVTLIVEGRPIYCHKIILAARSEHFKAMFFGGLKEAHQKEITLMDIQYDIFLDCLSYIYTDDPPFKTVDRAIEILGCVNYLKLDRLKAMCELTIKQNIDTENAGYLLQIASVNEAWQLKSFVMDFIMANYEEVEKTKSFDDLEKALLIEVTKEACKYLKGK
eukprot:TRINITY_DN1194_c0_g1_i4.p1 TRINITY_DN1194_c0_g1~~TRINITY_DN1194_c0_g1_i4.p1  ORF type:complete len:467 (+),score=130.95 TRINITY_DN1194_c0_g1_i4:23-1423(+)